MGVTDLGSGTDELTQFVASQGGVTKLRLHDTRGRTREPQPSRRSSAATADCVMTTQPTVGALETQKLAISAVDLATHRGCAKDTLGGAWPAAGLLAQASEWVNRTRTRRRRSSRR